MVTGIGVEGRVGSQEAQVPPISQELDPLGLNQVEDPELRKLLLMANSAIPSDVTWPRTQGWVVKLTRGIPKFEPDMSDVGIKGLLHKGIIGFVPAAIHGQTVNGYNREHVLLLVAYLDTKKGLPANVGPGPSRESVINEMVQRLGAKHPLSQLLIKEESQGEDKIGFIAEQGYAAEVTIEDLQRWLAKVSQLSSFDGLSMSTLSLSTQPSNVHVVSIVAGRVIKLASKLLQEKSIGAPDISDITNRKFSRYLEVLLSHVTTLPNPSEVTNLAELWQVLEGKF